MMEKKEEKREAIKPILVVPWIDKRGRAIFKTINREDAETLNAALDNPDGVLVKEPEEEDNVCPAEPDKPYEESICYIFNELFKKHKVKKRKEKKRCMCEYEAE